MLCLVIQREQKFRRFDLFDQIETKRNKEMANDRSSNTTIFSNHEQRTFIEKYFEKALFS